ncbi:DUF3039 domain-containing protein (plasmid) [Rhodococcus erythropolis]|uniref:DUF3039 domain-containing protein n=1 Tax=Rhodococcus TaxID=1827 RepID=UPI0012465D89|nr:MULTISPECIES: DUF3039 domain-containing protein [Rhodococcus]MCJ0949751.1 DUF3039 domain-containing protein [Rhodococcus sp. ARC_M8]MDJ0441185.1 DUF3039 domain-containing protein [Rhodococcus qingshengii]QEX08300.1 DUF3039 domain-containing protein [Rhodococcus erythropolis]QOS66376.1 DUF3039 domain-containing protein [Rhodococcus qingshengii]
MSHNRRARPTQRVLSVDLGDGWDDPSPQRAIVDRRWSDLHPFAELPHPLIRKASELYGTNPDHDPAPQAIVSAKEMHLLKVRLGQWRGAIWTDPETGVRWLCAAGLAKGGHGDRDDFYEQIADQVTRGRGNDLLPTVDDQYLLTRETAAWILTEWELSIQSKTRKALADLTSAPAVSFEVKHPLRDDTIATVEVTFGSDDPHMEEFVVEIGWNESEQGTDIGWQLIVRVLTSIAPRAQEWDVYGWTYSQIAEIGHRDCRISALSVAEAEERLLPIEQGTVSHYGHTNHLAQSAVEGDAVRALCGVFFVAVQDHVALPVCPECATRHGQLPR